MKRKDRQARNETFYQRSKNKKTIAWKPISKAAMWKRDQRKRDQREHIKEIEKKKQHREHQKKYLTNKAKCPDIIPVGPAYEYRMKKCRDMRKFKQSLPETPRRRASVISSYLQQNSPTIKTLEKMRVVRSPDEIVESHVLSDVKTALHKTRKSRSNENNTEQKYYFRGSEWRHY